MDENTPVTENPADEPVQPPAAKKRKTKRREPIEEGAKEIEMDENAAVSENTAEKPAQAPDDGQIVGVQNVTVSLPNIEGVKIDLPQPPPVEKIMVENSMAVSVSAQQDAEVSNSMVFSLAVGRDMAATNNLLINAAVGHDLDVKQGGAGILKVGGEAQVENGTIGLLITGSDITLNNSRILMTTPQAIALGAVFGAVYALLRMLLGRKGGRG